MDERKSPLKREWKKDEKTYYLPPTKPEVVEIPGMTYFVLEGRGNPNDPFFSDYIEALYGASYGLRMSHKGDHTPAGYYEYTVYPLEGVWDLTEEGKRLQIEKMQQEGGMKSVETLKEHLIFKLMIRQPEFVTEAWCLEQLPLLAKKKKNPLIEQIKLVKMEDGLCVQMMHKGSYDDEPASFHQMTAFSNEQGLERVDLTHREIYLSDARKTAQDQLKTVLRIQVKRLRDR